MVVVDHDMVANPTRSLDASLAVRMPLPISSVGV